MPTKPRASHAAAKPHHRTAVAALAAAQVVVLGCAVAVVLSRTHPVPVRIVTRPPAVAGSTDPSPDPSPDPSAGPASPAGAASPIPGTAGGPAAASAPHHSHPTTRPGPRTRAGRRATPAAVPGPTSWPALNTALAQIPAAATGATWVVSGRYGHWGTADWYHGTVYISPDVPPGLLFDVAVHEWSHLLSIRAYHGDVAEAVDAMNAFYGATGERGLAGAEDAADCMAILQGAGWTHYTSCPSVRWRAGARRLLAGQPL